MRRMPAIVSVLIIAITVSAQSPSVKPKWAKFENARIFYRDAGKTRQKNALVFVHGWACNSDFWNENLADFNEYRVIAIDLPGHGRSDKPKLDYSIEYFARSVNAVLEKAGVKKAVLVGHSMGTPVIRQFYRLFPDKVLGLVIVDGPLQPFAPRKDMEAFLAPLRANYRENAPKFIDGVIRGIKDERLKGSIRESMLKTPDYVAVPALEGMAEDKIWTNDKISVPVLAIMAEQTGWKAGTQEAYRSIAPNLEFHIWKNVSHFLMMEKPKEFDEQVLGFIVRNKLV